MTEGLLFPRGTNMALDLDAAAMAFREFVAIVRALRTPGTGCPWDLEQDHRSLRPYLVEETYEVLDALERGDDVGFCGELGDLLLQVVLHAQVADDRGAFSVTEVVRGIAAKMVRRHPHVFGTTRVQGVEEVRQNWEAIKAAETGSSDPSAAAVLARLPGGLPALARAQRVGEKAARLGLDPGPAPGALTTMLARLEALPDGAAAAGELGELLFGLCQLARRLGINAEDCLRDETRRYITGEPGT